MSLVCIEGCKDDDQDPFKKVPLDGFWEVATPASEQMDEAALADLRTTVSTSSGVYSFLIVRNGKIVHEQYHNGATQNALLHMRSITKRITATLVGIAIDQGDIVDQNNLISDFFPEIEEAGVGQGWDQVSIYHLLNMVSGMDWNENSDLNQYEQNLGDPLPFIFGKDIVHDPETYFSYNTPGTDLLPYIIERMSGEEIASYAQEFLFGPLGILGYEWDEIGDNVKRGGAGLQLTTRDLAKIGLLYLQNGQWQGQQLVSDRWVGQCFSDVIPLDILEGEHLPGISIGQTWWTREIDGRRIHYGDGYGGQILMVIPEHDIVIVMNRAWQVEPGRNSAAFNSFFDDILPAVLGSVIN